MLPRGRSRSGAASSTDSLDSILAQFEVVQATGPPVEPQPSPRQPPSPGAGLLSALLQHSPLQRLQLPGRPPRPEPTATSSPYQPKRRRRRQQGPDEQGYTSQQLLPFSGSPHPSQGPDSGRLADLPRAQQAGARLAVCLTADSPAVAAAAPPPAACGSHWRRDACASPSLESLASLGSGGSSPPRPATPRWGQQPAADPLFPLNLALPPYRPPSPATPREPAAWPEPARPTQQPEPHAAALGRAQPLASPFQAAAAQPALSDSSSDASEPAEAQQQDQRQPGAAPEPGSPKSCSRQSDADTPNSSSDYGSVTGADLGGGKEGGRAGGWSSPPPLFLGSAGKQPRPQLRKRDFESELLERLLSSSGRGPLTSPPREAAAAAPLPRAVWRAFGLPRLAFVATVFLCLLLCLAVFSAVRVHAQRYARAESALVAEALANPNSDVELLALALAAAAAAEPPRLQTAGDAKRHHSSASASSSLDPTHLHLHLDGPLEELRGAEDGKRRGRHAAAVGSEAAAEPQGARHKPGLRLLLLADWPGSGLA